MALESVSSTSSITWKLTKSVTGFESIIQGPITKTFRQNPDTDTYNQIYSVQHSLTGSGGTATINLQSFTNTIGEAVVMNGVIEIWVYVTGAGCSVDVEPGASDGLTWFFGGAITMVHGSHFKFGQGTTQTVDATHKNITLTNNGAGAAVVTLVILGKTA